MSKPRQSIRRFDVFAEWSRLEGLKDGLPKDEAQGYGLWLAKLVAARRFKRGSGTDRDGGEKDGEKDKKRATKWRTLSDEPQTDEMFQKEIIERMGADFYQDTFAPAVAEAFEKGQTYTQIRDAIRKEWKP